MTGRPHILLVAAGAIVVLVVLSACAAPSRGDVAERFQNATCPTSAPLSIVEADDQNRVDVATLHQDYRTARLALIRSARALASQSWPTGLQREVVVVERDQLEQARQFDDLQRGLWEGPGDVPGPSPRSKAALVTIRTLLHLTGDEPCGG